MLSLKKYENKLALDGLATGDANGSVVLLNNFSVIARTRNDSVANYTGDKNVFYGYDAGKNVKKGKDNVMIGYGAGINTENNTTNQDYSSYNIFIGKEAGYNNKKGYKNIFIGYENSKDNSNIATDPSDNNLAIGNHSSANYGDTLLIGHNSKSTGTQSSILGSRVVNSGPNSIIIGNDITNTGSNAVLIASSVDNNSNDNYLNIYGLIEGTKNTSVTLNENTNVNGTLSVANAASFESDLTVKGNLNLTNELVVTRIQTDYLTVNSESITGNTLEVTNQSFLKDDVKIYTDLSVGGTTYIDSLIIDGINMNSIINDLTNGSGACIEVQVTDVIPWLRNKQVDVNLSSFCNELAPWLEKTQDKISLAAFSNDLLPWVNSNQNTVALSGFCNDLNILDNILSVQGSIDLSGFVNNIDLAAWMNSNASSLGATSGGVKLSTFFNDMVPDWLEPVQSDVKLSFFNNDLIKWPLIDDSLGYSDGKNIGLTVFFNDLSPWLEYDQINVDLNSFCNDLAPWLRYDQINVYLSGFCNDLAPWVAQNQSENILSGFSNDLAPWLEYYQSNVSLNSFSNDLAPWLKYQQINVNLSGFCNDLAPWLSGIASNIPLSSFCNDLGIGSGRIENGTLSNLAVSNITATGDSLKIDANLTYFCGDVTIIGDLRANSIILEPYDISDIYNKALSNLDNFVDFENGLRAPGVILTSNENVFNKPVYFTETVHFSSNALTSIKPNPIFDEDVIIKGNLRGCECNSNGLIVNDDMCVTGNFKAGGLFLDGSNVNITGGSNNIITIEGNTLITSNLTVTGVGLFESNVEICGNLNLKNNLRILDTTSNGYWDIFANTVQNKTADLVFHSRNNNSTAFTDTFDPSIINHTAKHRATGIFPKQSINDLIGKIVISTGEYSDLYNEKKINIDEAIPIVKLSNKKNQRNVFGIISGQEDDGIMREFPLGNVRFSIPKIRPCKKYMINAGGEGAMWICNINGDIENGDYIVSSDIPGYGMKQDDDIHRNYTVAKSTCECTFDLNSKVYKCETFVYRKKTYKKAFIGVVYKC